MKIIDLMENPRYINHVKIFQFIEKIIIKYIFQWIAITNCQRQCYPENEI